MIAPVLRAGEDARADGIDDRDFVGTDAVIRADGGAAVREAVVAAPFAEDVLFDGADDIVTGLIGGFVEQRAEPLVPDGGDRNVPGGIHREELELDTGNIVFFRDGIVHGAEEIAYHGIRVPAAVEHILQHARRGFLHALPEAGKIGNAVGIRLHDRFHHFFHAAAERMEIQPESGDGFFKTGKSRERHLMAAGLQLAADEHQRADIPGRTDCKQGDFHENSPLNRIDHTLFRFHRSIKKYYITGPQRCQQLRKNRPNRPENRTKQASIGKKRLQ